MTAVRSIFFIFAFLSLSLLCSNTHAEEKTRTDYTLFHPVPDSEMRDFEADRPGKSESPISIDPGHFQFEIALISYHLINNDDRLATNSSIHQYDILPFNFKLGLLTNIDIELAFTPWIHQSNEDSTNHGTGDTKLRVKYNFWGNEGAATAFAVIPSITFPTNQNKLGNEAIAGGLAFPFRVLLPSEVQLYVTIELNLNQNQSNSQYHSEFVSIVYLSHPLVQKLEGFVELFNSLNHDGDPNWTATFDFGFAFKISNNLQLDTGLNLGLTQGADVLNPTIGIAFRY